MENLLRTAVRAVATTREHPDRAYRLRENEYVPDGIRRIARGQLDNAHDELFGVPKRKVGEAGSPRIATRRSCSRRSTP